MKSYTEMSKAELKAELAEVMAEIAEEKKKGHSLDMSRGKPDPTQLNLSMRMLEQNPYDLIYTRKGTDVRNYGELAGVDEAKELFADVLGVKMENIIMGGQSSLCLTTALSRRSYSAFTAAVSPGDSRASSSSSAPRPAMTGISASARSSAWR